jgi:hypothetical protein
MIRHERDPVLDSLRRRFELPRHFRWRAGVHRPDHLATELRGITWFAIVGSLNAHVPVFTKPGQLQRDLKLYARRRRSSSCCLDQGLEVHRIHMSLKCRLALTRPDNGRFAFPTLCANIYSAQKPFLCFHPISDARDFVVVCCL